VRALRKIGVGARLRALVVLLLCFLGGVAALGYLQVTRGSDAAAELNASSANQSVAQTAQFDFADLNGWQNAYAFDVALRGPAGAADTAPNRKQFLVVAERTRAGLAALVTEMEDGTPAQRELAATTLAKFEEFMALDVEIVNDFRKGTEAGDKAATKLVNVDEVALYDAGAGAVDKLAEQLHSEQLALGEQTRAAGSTARLTLLLVSLAGAVFALLAAVVVTASITGPLNSLRERLRSIAHGDGDLTLRLDGDGHDELGEVSRLFNTFIEQIAGTVREVNAAASSLAAATEEFSGNTSVIAAATEQTSAQASVVAEASRAVSSGVTGFSTAASELGLSIGEIAHNATEAARVAATAVDLARHTTDTVQKLGQSSAEISGVVEMINGVAEQTNLLALNATIEAARAGDAGKGFAVVATEVKDLAQETARATQDITVRIEQIQAETAQAVTAITEIAQVIAQINDFQGSIAGAVEEQTVTASQMTSTVDEAARGSDEISTNIAGVAESASATARSLGESRQATEELARMGAHLQGLVARFQV
jgi:methyl-accepting chemotaxis protein